MNETVAIILPRWMAYLLVAICILQVIETCLNLYRDHLVSKLNRK